ncbi:hypothetical protein EV2_035615 [Malus domestica]
MVSVSTSTTSMASSHFPEPLVPIADDQKLSLTGNWTKLRLVTVANSFRGSPDAAHFVPLLPVGLKPALEKP